MRMVHPLTSAVYESQDDGSVRVTDTEGRQGWFTPQGDYLRGQLRAADPHIIDWVGGRQAKRLSGRLRLNTTGDAS
ncbi:MAG TPA: hypothetical protein VFN68_16220 [Acidimicrobiales bacterium]|nr:hypothetical protein [Acidimicrobiales bacterium]